MNPRYLLPVLTLMLSLASGLALGQSAFGPRVTEPRLGPPSKLDQRYLAQQRQSVDHLLGRHLGRGVKGDRRDLESLQLLLDRRLVEASDERTLQAMGIVLGDVIATDLGMHWVIYEDSEGRSRALQLKEHKKFLFPATMISRRYQAGAEVEIEQLYEQVTAPLRPLSTASPFD